VIVIADGVLDSGKHFEVAQSLIRSRWPNGEVRGVFLARGRGPFEPTQIRVGLSDR
jgi:hypothetical protein